MKQTFTLVLTLTVLFSLGCGSKPSTDNTAANANAANANATNANAANTGSQTPADGFFPGKGVITKINDKLGSVEMAHEEIPGLMPAMTMEFSVKNKAMLKGLVVGDAVTFTIEHKQGSEIIIAIGK